MLVDQSCCNVLKANKELSVLGLISAAHNIIAVNHFFFLDHMGNYHFYIIGFVKRVIINSHQYKKGEGG